MASDIVQAQYEKIDTIAQRFAQHGDAISNLQARLQQSSEALNNGGWQGQGAAAFNAEMEGTILPATRRLSHALRMAQKVTLEIKAIIEQAEEEAAAPFRQGQYQNFALFAAPGAVNPAGAAAPPKNAYVIDQKDLRKYYGKANGNGECAGIAQNHFNNPNSNKSIGKVKTWRPGPKLTTHPNLKPGTVIATFDQNGRYPNKKHGNHVAIFLDYAKDKNGKIIGVKVLDQWGGKPASERVIEFVTAEEAKKKRRPASGNNGGLLVNQANDMSVVTKP